LYIWRSATPFSLVSSNLLVSCCDVRFPATFLFFFFTPILLANDFYCCRHLLGLRWWNLPYFWTDRGSWEIIRGSRKFLVWSPASSCYCASPGSCSAHWRGSWWLSKVSDYHALRDASS
jgi:hypothetical protein